ncbi:hypothetical protein [Campylobacter fetus]|uniref:hypothetical protein n=1 Tax=Campylobacter fetus TaxID=196 RepID=UPI001CB919DA|nr:hypothetical protein [Campylobacter fetus]
MSLKLTKRYCSKASELLNDSDALSINFESLSGNKLKVSFGFDVKVKDADTLAVLLGINLVCLSKKRKFTSLKNA